MSFNKTNQGKNNWQNYGLESLDGILSTVVENLGLDKKLSLISFLKLWPEVVGPKFKDKTKAISITKKNGVDLLVVATSSSVVSQELGFFKKELLNKLNPPSKKFGFDVRDILFNTKIWNEYSSEPKISDSVAMDSFEKLPEERELEKIELPESIIISLKDAIDTQKFSTPELKERMIRMMIKDVKLQIWKKNNGYPFCSKCGVVVDTKDYRDKEILCPACKYN